MIMCIHCDKSLRQTDRLDQLIWPSNVVETRIKGSDNFFFKLIVFALIQIISPDLTGQLLMFRSQTIQQAPISDLAHVMNLSIQTHTEYHVSGLG
jgi:hypothetical protein